MTEKTALSPISFHADVDTMKKKKMARDVGATDRASWKGWIMRHEQEKPQDKVNAIGDTIKVLVVAGRGPLQQALVAFIDHQPDTEVRSLVTDMREAKRWLVGGAANVILMDWPLANPEDVGILRELMTTRAGLGFLAVSLYDDPFSVKQAFNLGVHGYLTKALAAETIGAAIRAVSLGRRYCSPDVTDAFQHLN
jgi:DNA-binding NarL/FixJ family response regulator